MKPLSLLDFGQRVVVLTDGFKRAGVICGRAYDNPPRYNIDMNDTREIVKDITPDRIAVDVAP